MCNIYENENSLKLSKENATTILIYSNRRQNYTYTNI